MFKDDTVLECKYCFKIFSRNDSLRRHLKSRCKIKIENEKQKEIIFQGLMQKMENMENRINELETENVRLQGTQGLPSLQNTNLTTINNTTNTNNNTINNITNNNLSIQLVAFGQEDKDQLSNMELFKIIKKGFKSVPEFVKVLHFDENRPENHNIFIPNMRDGYIMIFDGEKWNLVDRIDTIENLFDDGRNFLAEKKDKLKEILNDKNKRVLIKFDRFNKDIDDYPSKKNEILTDIKLLLDNN